MAIIKCKGCGDLFNSFAGPFCPKCMHEIDYKYKIVRDYLYDNPNETMEQVSQETETPEWMLMYFLRDGRLNIMNASGLIRCENCGKSITTGRYCNECTMKLGSKIQGALPKKHEQEKTDGKGRMHTGIGRDFR